MKLLIYNSVLSFSVKLPKNTIKALIRSGIIHIFYKCGFSIELI